MYSFLNDYSEGAHENILRALIETNHESTVGYGLDEYTKEAINLILNELKMDADIHFASGGTQANILVISHLLRPYESIIACDSGHINTHEAGSIESRGHKILTIKNVNGKITIDDIKKILSKHQNEHMVKPKLVYISNATEIGTSYTKEELEALYRFTKVNDLYLFIDGARLSNVLCNGDLTLADVARNCDVFYFGGTKNGALFGEAIIFTNKLLAKDFRYTMKQNGSILAKGRILGIQFKELFKDRLYLKLAKKANDLARIISDELIDLNVKLLTKTNTNQIFPVLDNIVIEKLKEKYLFEIWEDYDELSKVVRFVTSWDTKKEAVDALLEDLKIIYAK